MDVRWLTKPGATLRYKSKLHHIGMGRARKGLSIILLVAGRHIRIIDEEGELLRDFELDRAGTTSPEISGDGVHYAPRHLSTMPRDITSRAGGIRTPGHWFWRPAL